MTDGKTKLTITLTDARPIRIAVAEWPIIAKATDRRWEGEHEFQATRSSRMAIRVRQHSDGRAVVYGSYSYDTSWRGANCREIRGGDALNPGVRELEDAIMSVARDLANRIGEDEFGLDMVELGRQCVADLPAVEV